MTLPEKVGPPERQALLQLYEDGAWTTEETASFPCVEALITTRLAARLNTDIGPLTLLRRAGMEAIFGRDCASVSPQVALDRAYLRLCVRDLNWTVLRPAYRGRKSDVPQLRRYALVRTDQGEAYVIARLTGGGYSTSGLKKAVAGLRGTLLYQHRTLVILTPNMTRGKGFERQETGIVRIVRHRPNATPAGKRLNSGTVSGTLWADGSPHDGPLLTPESQAIKRLAGMPQRTAELLSLPRDERVEAAIEALRTDQVLGLWWRWSMTPGRTRW